MAAPEVNMKKEEEEKVGESKQLDSTVSEHSTTHLLKEEGKEDLTKRRPLTAAPIFLVKSL